MPSLTPFFTGGGRDLTLQLSSHSNDQVFNTNFCGDWAGGVWPQSPCALLAPTCAEYVGKNPSVYRDSYWQINSLRVYQQQGGDDKPAPSYRMSKRYGRDDCKTYFWIISTHPFYILTCPSPSPPPPVFPELLLREGKEEEEG